MVFEVLLLVSFFLQPPRLYIYSNLSQHIESNQNWLICTFKILYWPQTHLILDILSHPSPLTSPITSFPFLYQSSPPVPLSPLSLTSLTSLSLYPPALPLWSLISPPSSLHPLSPSPVLKQLSLFPLYPIDLSSSDLTEVWPSWDRQQVQYIPFTPFIPPQPLWSSSLDSHYALKELLAYNYPFAPYSILYSTTPQTGSSHPSSTHSPLVMLKISFTLPLLAVGLLGMVRGASYSPTLDPNDVKSLRAATTAALKNLLSYYNPGSVSHISLLVPSLWSDLFFFQTFASSWCFRVRYLPRFGTLIAHWMSSLQQGGSFEQVQTPWHESQMIWGMFMDHAKYTGDTQFLSLVTGALVNSSYGSQQ